MIEKRFTEFGLRRKRSSDAERSEGPIEVVIPQTAEKVKDVLTRQKVCEIEESFFDFMLIKA